MNRWITTDKGIHILVKDGQSEKEAIDEFFNDKYENDLDENAYYNLEEEGLKANKYLNREEKVAIQKYTNDSSEYNFYLRNNYKDNINFNGIIKNLDSAIEKFELKNDIIVYRIANEKWLNIINKKENDIVEDKAYTSTTIKEDALEKIKSHGAAHGNIIYKIKVKKGKGKGFYTPYQSHFGFEEEEFLLPRNQKFKIVSKKDNEIELEAL